MPKGRPAKVDHVREAFTRELDSAAALVGAIKALPVKVRPSNNPGLHPKHSGQVIELAFMAVVASWEEFLERSLVRYLTGAKTDRGYEPNLKVGRADTIQHAYELLSRDPNYDPEKSYLKVSDPRWVRTVSDFFFSSHPYNCLLNSTALIGHANSIRNRVAHDSTKCKAEFKATAIYFLQPQGDQLKQGYGPASLLQEPVVRHFGQNAIAQQQSHFDAYIDLYRQMASAIVPK